MTGLNRRLDNLSNSIAAAQVAVSEMPNLRALELGNEPDGTKYISYSLLIVFMSDCEFSVFRL